MKLEEALEASARITKETGRQKIGETAVLNLPWLHAESHRNAYQPTIPPEERGEYVDVVVKNLILVGDWSIHAKAIEGLPESIEIRVVGQWMKGRFYQALASNHWKAE